MIHDEVRHHEASISVPLAECPEVEILQDS